MSSIVSFSQTISFDAFRVFIIHFPVMDMRYVPFPVVSICLFRLNNGKYIVLFPLSFMFRVSSLCLWCEIHIVLSSWWKASRYACCLFPRCFCLGGSFCFYFFSFFRLLPVVADTKACYEPLHFFLFFLSWSLFALGSARPYCFQVLYICLVTNSFLLSSFLLSFFVFRVWDEDQGGLS